jgi:hypothetical protein
VAYNVGFGVFPSGLAIQTVANRGKPCHTEYIDKAMTPWDDATQIRERDMQMTDLNFLAVIAASLVASLDKADKALSAYNVRLIEAHDLLTANGIQSVAPLRDKGETRDAWLDSIAAAYLSKREFAAWKKDGALRSKDLEAEGNKQGLTEKGKLNNRVSKRSTDIVADLEKVFAAEGADGAEKTANAKKGPNANAPRALDIRIAEEISKLIKAVDKDAAAEKPTLKKHGVIKAALDKAAADIKAALK